MAVDLPETFTITINGHKYNKKQIKDLYDGLITENLLESFAKVEKKFTNIDNLQKFLYETIGGNPRYGMDVKSALTIVTITDPTTGKQIRVFNIPLNSPTISDSIQELITSAFKNGVTRQHIKGGSATLTSNVWLTNNLHLVKDKDGTVIGTEAYLPAYSKKFFDAYLIEAKDPITKNTYYKLDINKVPENLKKIIGYRIPTENKCSILPLYIKGFLPQQNGSSIMVSAEITTISGSDFDIDKMFLMLPEFDTNVS